MTLFKNTLKNDDHQYSVERRYLWTKSCVFSIDIPYHDKCEVSENVLKIKVRPRRGLFVSPVKLPIFSG